VLLQIYKVGEELNGLIEHYLTDCVAAKQISLDKISPPRATFILWAGITGIITMAHKKEAYINKAMGISKTEFMRDGFRLLQKSIGGQNDE
jgi:hypothetical protein